MAWTVSLQDETRDFIGRDALVAEKQRGIEEKLVGLVMEQPGVLRNHQRVVIEGDAYGDGSGEGEVTSGGFSPTLGHAIALARVPMATKESAMVERRGQLIPVEVIKPPFVRHGKRVF